MKKLIAVFIALQALAWPAHAQTTLRPTQIRGISSDTVYGTGGIVTNGSPTITTPTLSGTTTAGAINASGQVNLTGGALRVFGALDAGQLSANVMDWQTTGSNARFLSYGPNGVAGNFTFTSVVGNGSGTVAATITSTGINSTVIGATTPAAGSFTTLSASGNISVGSGSSVKSVTVDGGTGTAEGASFGIKGGGGFLGSLGTHAAINGSGTNQDTVLQAQGASNNLALNSVNGNVNIQTAGTNRGVFSSTGLAVTGALSATGGVSTTGSISGYGGGEVILAGGSGSQNSLSTTGGGAIEMVFDHRGSGNTGSFRWRNGTGASTTLMTLDASSVLDTVGGYKVNGGTTLSNYTEGTCTLGFRGSSTAGTFTYTVQACRYQRVGNRVHFDFNLVTSGSSGSPAGNAEITGLPVTPANTASNYAVCMVSGFSVTHSGAFDTLQVWVDPNTTVMRVFESGVSGGAQQYSALPISAIGSSTSLRGTCTYVV